ncbi:MAG: sigma-70 region 4 domain-containing protein [Patescibacteria group bacterium]|nr:sigma-70 region 4 domain-containing protein [Patescibacteria group bacterium]
MADARGVIAPEVYTALRGSGMSNREIARQLGVNEASVRRGLKRAGKRAGERRFLVTVTELD